MLHIKKIFLIQLYERERERVFRNQLVACEDLIGR
jgi:hypothetical protein